MGGGGGVLGACGGSGSGGGATAAAAWRRFDLPRVIEGMSGGGAASDCTLEMTGNPERWPFVPAVK